MNDARRDRLLAFGLGLASAALYAVQAAPGVYVGDSGELVTAAATLGLAHPTGYPLYLLVGRAWIALLGFLTPAYAMNLLSAACGGGAVAAMVLLVRALGVGRAGAALAGVLLAGCPTFWAEATVARVYTPNLLLMLLAALALARFRVSARPAPLAASFALTGLGLAVHTVSVVLGLPLALALADRRLPLSTRLRLPLWLLPGLALYLYVPIASSFDPAQNWGDPSTFANLLKYLKREDYWQRAWVHGPADVVAALAHYASILPRDLTWLGLPLAALGAWHLGRAGRWALGSLLGVAAATVALVLMHGSRNDIFQRDRYVLPALAALAVLAGVGVERATTWLGGGGRRGWVLPALALAPLALGVPQMDRSRFTLADGYARRVLERLPQDSVLIADGDNQLFPLSYLHHAEGLRPDVNLVLQGINVLSSMPIEPETHPVFFTHYFDLHADPLVLLPEGLTWRLYPPPGATPRALPRWADWAVPEIEGWASQGPLDFLARSLVGDYFLQKAVHYEDRHPLAAVEAVRANLSAAHDNPVNVTNGALVLERLGLVNEAVRAFQRCLDLDARSEPCARHLRDLESRQKARGTTDEVQATVAEAVARFQQGNPEAAALHLQEAATRWPASDRVHYNLGALALQAGQYPAALREMLITLDLHPNDDLARRDIGEIDKRLTR